MYITSNRKVIATVTNLLELDSFIIKSKNGGKPSHFLTCSKIDYQSILSNETLSEIQLMKKINNFFSKEKKNRSVRSKGFWMIRGFSEIEATKKVHAIQSKCAPSSKNYSGYNGLSDDDKTKQILKYQSEAGKKGGAVMANDSTKRNTHIDYYLAKGLSKSESHKALKDRQSTFSMKKLLKQYEESEAIKKMNQRNQKWFLSLKSNNDMVEFNKSKNKWRNDKTKVRLAAKKRINTLVEKGQILDRSFLTNLEYYYRLVWSYTRLQPLSLIKNIEKRSNEWHLDHIYSIKAGFVNNVPAHIIGNIHNLRIIPAKENCSKREGCHQTIDDILEKIKSETY